MGFLTGLLDRYWLCLDFSGFEFEQYVYIFAKIEPIKAIEPLHIDRIKSKVFINHPLLISQAFLYV